MGLNIKNEEVQRLVRELAEKTGKGQTEAIGMAVRAALDQIDHAAASRERYDKIMAIARETGPLFKGFDMDEAMYGENGLYDRETGLPK